MDFEVQPGGALTGSVRVPGDKSISHRAVMLGAIAEGETRVSGFLHGADALATVAAFSAMGVPIERDHDSLLIRGVGLHGLRAPQRALDVGNSGTTMRLLSGLLSGQAFDVTLTGDPSLSRRPMERVAAPLRSMGARIDTAEGGRPPLQLHGGQKLTGIRYAMPVASAQVKSCLLLAGLYAEGETAVTEPAPTRDHTERMLQGFGYMVQREGPTAWLDGGGTLTGCSIEVPADISSAAFFLVGASIAPGSDITLRHVGINPTRTGIIDILRLMGAAIDIIEPREVGGEPVADIRVRHAPLRGIDIPEELVPLAIDEFPAIFIAAACAAGRTVLTGAEELRVKESDRIAVMAEGLESLGIRAQPTDDGIRIEGGQLRGGQVTSHHDHRIAMAFAMAVLRADGPIRIVDCDNVSTSFPDFVPVARSAGLNLEVR